MGLFDRFKKAAPAMRSGAKALRKGPPGGDPAPWITDELWRGWGPPLDIVSGESHCQDHLVTIAGPPRPGGWLVACEAELQREPKNRYDRDAIAVLIAGRKVGYITRHACGDLAEELDQHGANARASGVPALVRGGWTGRPNLGVLLWLHHEEVRESLPGVEWDELIEDFECDTWPPRGEAGRADATDAPTRTGAQRRKAPAPAPRGEPRMPPLVAHYTDYEEDVQELKRRREHERAVTLLISLIDAAEAESSAQGVGVPPWYYEQLAIVRRKQGDLAGEISVLERYAALPHAPGAGPAKLLARLEDARARLARRNE